MSEARSTKALMARAGEIGRDNPVAFVIALTAVLIIANVAALPAFAGAGALPGELGTLSPFALAAMASTPSILGGGGGIDLSIAPLMGLSNVIFVVYLLPHGLGNPGIAIPMLLFLGAVVGCLNGVLVAVLRFPPVIATLGVYFILDGLDLELAPNPVSTNPNWTNQLAGTLWHVPGTLFSVGAVLLVWFLIRRTPYHGMLLAVGGDDAASYSAGVRVGLVRVLAYTFGGMIAGFAGVVLTGTIQSADVTIWPQYVLIALAAVALGGTALSGGRGGFVPSLLGATSVYLIQNLIAALGVSVFYLQVAYGGVLLIAVVLGSKLARIGSTARTEERVLL